MSQHGPKREVCEGSREAESASIGLALSVRSREFAGDRELLEIFLRLADKRLPASRDGRDHEGVAHICANAESNQKGGIAKQMLCLMRLLFWIRSF